MKEPITKLVDGVKRCLNYEANKCKNSPDCKGWEGYGCTGDLKLEGSSGYSVYKGKL